MQMQTIAVASLATQANVSTEQCARLLEALGILKQGETEVRTTALRQRLPELAPVHQKAWARMLVAPHAETKPQPPTQTKPQPPTQTKPQSKKKTPPQAKKKTAPLDKAARLEAAKARYTKAVEQYSTLLKPVLARNTPLHMARQAMYKALKEHRKEKTPASYQAFRKADNAYQALLKEECFRDPALGRAYLRHLSTKHQLRKN